MKESKTLLFLYTTAAGRLLLRLAASRTAARICAAVLKSPLSVFMIKGFIKKNNIDMSVYEKKKYASFNDFFTRNIKPGERVTGDGFIAVCDSRLSIYEADERSLFYIKGSVYITEELAGRKTDYKYALIFRLEPDDYHHYIFPDSGRTLDREYIKGVLHTVRPIAQKAVKVFHENCRSVTRLDCDEFGEICYIEVGAMLIGKITNRNTDTFKKGEEKGYFEFGGSTVILLVKNDIRFDETILENTRNGIETKVRLGEKIGESKA